MDTLLRELSSRFDASKPLGYLNFADGQIDPKFRKFLADAFAILKDGTDSQPWQTCLVWFQRTLAELQQSGSAAFRDVTQAAEILPIAFEEVPAAYRKHHRDLLAHQTDSQLFNAFFLARCCEVALIERAASTPRSDIVTKCLSRLNDFVGYRPIAILESRSNTQFYDHEKVCAVPLYFRNVGVAPGPYSDVIRAAWELLTQTNAFLLEEACLDPDKVDELAVDPRATDHFHPVNKRPNVLFGEWDPHHIDINGYYRRFVIREGTLNTLMTWACHTPGGAVDPDRLFEASAVMAGTILMGAGICGTGPDYHDSSVTLATIVQKIARFRDTFYQQLLDNLQGSLGERLRAEAQKLKQPFGGVRQALNRAIASERALHLQERRLATFFAAMGYPTVARQRASAIPAPAARMAAEIRLRQTAVMFANRAGHIEHVPQLLSEAEDLLNRGIECGALIDPWNILGFQALFPTFSDRADTVRDPRAEELILTVGRQLDCYAHALSVAAAEENPQLTATLKARMQKLADWWDKFATSTVTDLPKVEGGKRTEAAEHVAKAMVLWRQGGATDPKFWRNHLDAFQTPAAYAQVIEALLDQADYKAAMALLVTWLNEADTVPLQDPSGSFFRLAFRWVRSVSQPVDEVQLPEHRSLIRRFFELMEANSDERWHVPEFFPQARTIDDDDDEEDATNDFGAAYEEMSYQDSTDDGIDSSLADGDSATAGHFSLDSDAETGTERLRFLAAIARLWRLSARPELFPKSDSQSSVVVLDWVRQARTNLSQLMKLAQSIYAIPIPNPIGGVDAASEYDRRRSVRGNLLEACVQTAVETAAAARGLAALVAGAAELPQSPAQNLGPSTELFPWESLAIRLERAIALADSASVQYMLPNFVKLFRGEPLLVCPLSDGGQPQQALRAQMAQQMMESLLARLPRLGLLRETYQLTRLARNMERNHMPEGRRVSSYDVLFRTAVVGTVDALLVASRDWSSDAAEDGPLSDAIQQICESYQSLWVEHSHTLRLSSLEVARDNPAWNQLVDFIKKYGSDLFTVRFLTVSNMRAILALGAAEWLERESENPQSEFDPKLIRDWAEGTVERHKAARQFEIVLQALIEQYDEYRDYNTTTTQSDYGENLYVLMDFLRLKVGYDRSAWLLKPLILAHEVLCRRGYDRLAGKWREFIASKTRSLAEELLTELKAKESEHGLILRTVRDRLEERFVLPLQVDQAGARVARASAAARDGQPEDNPTFAGLLAAMQPLAESPVGVGLDVPLWVRRLEEELRKVRIFDPEEEDGESSTLQSPEDYPLPPQRLLDYEEFQQQIQKWDDPI